MKKIIVIGCPGSGKSTFARKLRDITGLPLYYLDMIWHKPDKTTVTREEFDTELEKILEKDSFIIDGNYGRTLEKRFLCCDTVFLFDLPTEVCLEGARSRIGKKRDDLPWTETELDGQFKEWIIGFRERELRNIYAFVEKYRSEREIHIFKTRQEADSFLLSLEKMKGYKFK